MGNGEREVFVKLRDTLQAIGLESQEAIHGARDVLPAVMMSIAEAAMADGPTSSNDALRRVAVAAETTLAGINDAGRQIGLECELGTEGLDALSQDVHMLADAAREALDGLSNMTAWRRLKATLDPMRFSAFPPLILQEAIDAPADVCYLWPLGGLAETGAISVPDSTFTFRLARMSLIAVIQAAIADRLTHGQAAIIRLARSWKDAAALWENALAGEQVTLWARPDVEPDPLINASGVALRHLYLGSPLEVSTPAEFVWFVIRETGWEGGKLPPNTWPGLVERWNRVHAGDQLNVSQARVRWHRHRPQEFGSPA